MKRDDPAPMSTTLLLHVALVRDADVAAARFHTRWLESWLAANPLANSP
jgi:acetyl-CoA carboxylase biotin carboxylase subunit